MRVNVHVHTEKTKESHNKDKGPKPGMLLKVTSALLLQNLFFQTLGLTDTLLYCFDCCRFLLLFLVSMQIMDFLSFLNFGSTGHCMGIKHPATELHDLSP